MRNPKRIEPLLKLIKEVWELQPDRRLLQLLDNALAHSMIARDPFHIEDEQLEEALKDLKKYFEEGGF